MKIVVAPDSFAGTLSAVDAAAAIARGWRSARPDDELVLAPMSDGGEGLIDAVAAAVAEATRHEAEVLDARGRAVTAVWLALPDGRALIESAQACGLVRLTASARDPATATSFGVGQLLLAARAAGCDQLVVGLGGSASMDGGAGAVVALGHRVERRAGELVQVERGGMLGASVVLAADVDSPLLGREGAARFARQKGATEEQLPALERDLERFADVVERDLDGGPWRELPGAGAAGGIGFGLAAFCGARLVPGAPLVAELVELEQKLDRASIVVTGEGALDGQTGAGKVPAFVLGLARRRGSKVYAIAGRVEDGAGDPFDAVAALGPEGLRRPAERLAGCAAELARSL
jgi:glycerate 2-kinase